MLAFRIRERKAIAESQNLCIEHNVFDLKTRRLIREYYYLKNKVKYRRNYI